MLLALTNFASWTTLACLVVGLVIGILIGVIPGLGPLAGISLAIPFTFYLDPVAGMAVLIGIYHGGSYGGALTACLIGVPGTPIAAATMLDGHPMTLAGRGSEAATLSTLASVVGAIIGAVVLIAVSQPLASLALRIGPVEICALSLLGLTAIGSVTEGSVLKGVLAGVAGLAIATIGDDPLTGFGRFDFGISALQGGINLVVVMMGIFGIAEVITMLERGVSGQTIVDRVRPSWAAVRYFATKSGAVLRASGIGIVIGAIPGVGAVTSAYLAYAVAKASSRDPDSFGKGNPDGVIATETANSATVGGAILPMLAIGIPGEPIVAALMAGLMIHGLAPGPLLFATNPDVVSGIYVAVLVGAVLMLPIAFLGLPLFLLALKVPRSLLAAAVFLLCIAGVYALVSSLADLWVMLFFGAVGYLMRRFQFPVSPLILGLVLGPIFEANLRRTVVMGGDHLIGYVAGRPIALVVLGLCLAAITWNVVVALRSGRSAPGALVRETDSRPG
ncbi:MAG: tripartite tricarboxylate transporter permease [Rhizobiaceae bacterium]